MQLSREDKETAHPILLSSLGLYSTNSEPACPIKVSIGIDYGFEHKSMAKI